MTDMWPVPVLDVPKLARYTLPLAMVGGVILEYSLQLSRALFCNEFHSSWLMLLASRACRMPGWEWCHASPLVMIAAHTIPLVFPFAEMESMPPGCPLLAVGLIINGVVLKSEPLNL